MTKNKTNIKEETSRYFSLQTKLGLSFSILTIVISAMLIFVMYQTIRGKLREGIRQRLYDIVNISSLQIDGDAHAELVNPEQEGNNTYTHIKHILQNIRDKGTGIRYVYTWRRNADGQILFVVDAETDPEKISHLGDVYESEPSLLAELAALDRPIVDKEFTTDKWGIWLSGYAPFYRSDGQMEGILGVDIAASDVMSYERRFLWIALGVFLAAIPPASLSGWLLGRKLIAPIIRLTVGSKRIAKGDLSYRVAVQSNDEVGSLAKSFNAMTDSLQKTIMNLDQEIAHRKQAENTLEVINKDLESTVRQLSQVNRELNEFAYITAHDLKSPIRAIGSLAGIISNDCRDILNEQSKQHLDMLIQRTMRMNEFINSILKYASLGNTAVQKEKIDVGDIVKKIISHIQGAKENFNITVEDELPVVISQKSHIAQIFQSLLDNAVKYIDKPKGQIKIGCVEQDNFWKFSVADNGPGIEEKHFDKIFQIFQTLTRRDKIESTGIGLSVVRKIVEMHGGKVWVESKVGEGSVFFFTLPKQETGIKSEQLYADVAG